MRNLNFSARSIRVLAGIIVAGLWNRGILGKVVAVPVAVVVAVDAVSSIVLVSVINAVRSVINDIKGVF